MLRDISLEGTIHSSAMLSRSLSRDQVLVLTASRTRMSIKKEREDIAKDKDSVRDSGKGQEEEGGQHQQPRPRPQQPRLLLPQPPQQQQQALPRSSMRINITMEKGTTMSTMTTSMVEPMRTLTLILTAIPIATMRLYPMLCQLSSTQGKRRQTTLISSCQRQFQLLKPEASLCL